MSPNVGTIDRLARAALGVVLIYLAFFSGMALMQAGLWKYLAAIVGIVLLATAALRMCPLYRLLGISTCRI